MAELMLLIADRLGVFVFALSGGVVAVRLRMDVLGVVVMAFLPAIGGGTLRDLILDQPVFWLDDTLALALATAGGLTTFFAHPLINRLDRPLRMLDAGGMALFATTGAAKTLALGLPFGIVLLMGAVTACAGGLLRDVVANQEPLLLRQDIYATAAVVAAGAYAGSILLGLPPSVAFGAGVGSGFALRMAAIAFKLSLPTPPFLD